MESCDSEDDFRFIGLPTTLFFTLSTPNLKYSKYYSKLAFPYTNT